MSRAMSTLVAAGIAAVLVLGPSATAWAEPELNRKDKRYVRKKAKRIAKKQIGKALPLAADGLATGSVTNPKIADGAVTAAKLDPDLLKGLSNVAYVAKDGGDYTSPLHALGDLGSWCGIPSQANPCLVYIGPGVYQLGGDAVEMVEHVSIRGSGREATHLKGAVSGATFEDGAALIQGADRVSVSDLSITNTATGAVAIALFANEVELRVQGVEAIAEGAAENFGVYNFRSDLTMLDVESRASGGSKNTGVFSFDGPIIMTNAVAEASGLDGSENRGVVSFAEFSVITNVVAEATGGSDNVGVEFIQTAPTLTHVTAHAEGPFESVNYGMRSKNASSAPMMTNVHASASGGSSSIGFEGADGVVESSVLEGSSAGLGIVDDDLRVANTRIVGGVFDFDGTVQCRDTYDADLDDVDC